MAKKEGKDVSIPKINLNPSFPAIPKVSNKTKVDVRYSLIPPYAYAHIHWDEEEKEVIYELEEPLLSSEEKEALETIKKSMREVVNINILIEKTTKSMLKYIHKTAKLLISEMGLQIKEDSYKKIFYYLYRDYIGLGKVEPLIKDYFIEDIECNGANLPTYIVHRKFRNIKTKVIFKDMDILRNFVEKLAQRCGKYVSYANPLLDGSLPDGSRVNASYTEDVTSKGPTFTIRKFTKTPWTPTQLIKFDTLSPEMLAYFWLLIEHECNLLIAGGTSSGKTSLLNALAFFMPPEKRIVTIEDTRELNLEKENWLPSVARTAMGTGKTGEVDLFSLLKNSFRQNPNYVIVGEVRGKEAFVLFQGMSSGHPSISTMHADSVDTVIKRLQTPPIELSPTLINTLDAVAIMSHAIVSGEETRKLRKVTEVVKVDPQGVALTNTPFIWSPKDDKFYFKKDSKVFGKIGANFGMSNEELQEEFNKRTKLLYEWYKGGLFDFKKVQDEIDSYYQDPKKALEKYGVT